MKIDPGATTVGETHPPEDEYEYKPLDEKYFGFKTLYSSDFKRKKIPQGVEGDDVYRLLPYDPEVEYGGYITPRNIFYRRGDEREVTTDFFKETTFHTHIKTDFDTNRPSPGDMSTFVRCCTRRHILVGPEYITIMEKTPEHDEFFREYKRFEDRLVVELLHKCGPDIGPIFLSLISAIFKERGIEQELTYETWNVEWRDIAENLLKITVQVVPRQSPKGANLCPAFYRGSL